MASSRAVCRFAGFTEEQLGKLVDGSQVVSFAAVRPMVLLMVGTVIYLPVVLPRLLPGVKDPSVLQKM